MKSSYFFLSSLSILASVHALVSDAPYFFNKTKAPLVLAHRGSSGKFPEHTLGAYSSAFASGVDFVELDLQITKDGQFITSHDPTLKEVSNIEDFSDLYGDRMGNFTIQYSDTSSLTYTNDYLIQDFTLAEIKTLKRTQRYDYRNQMLNDIWGFLTLNETIELMQTMQIKMPDNRDYPIGLYIETKQYNWYLDTYGLDSAQMLHDHLSTYSLDTVEKCTSTIPIIVECFESASLRKFATLSDIPLIYLMNSEMCDAADFSDIASFAHGVGPTVSRVFENDFMTNAQFEHELQVHPYVVRDEYPTFTQDAIEENMLYLEKGVNGIFTEHPHLTLELYKDAL